MLNNPRSSVKEEDLGKPRYLYKISKFVEICALEAYERVDWVKHGWIALYEIPFRDGVSLPIPNLVRDVLDHFEITPSQLMPNVWRLLMPLECMSKRYGIVCELEEVLYSYYLKEHDMEKGRF